MAPVHIAVTTNVDNSVTRIEHEGRVYRWERPVGAWPGHTCFVVLRGGEVVLGDRYAHDGVTRSYACTPEALLEGCFQELISEQLGPPVLEEVLAEVRRELGETRAREAERKAELEAKLQATPQPKPEPKPEPEPEPKVAAAEATPSQPVAAPDAARVSVTLTACTSVDLALAVALRRVTRGSVAELLPRLQAPPVVLVTDVERAQGEAIASDLRSLGATVQLGPAQ